MPDVYTHYVVLECDRVRPGDRLIINGTAYNPESYPDDWGSLNSDKKHDWYRKHSDIKSGLYANLKGEEWVLVGRITHDALKSRLYDVSVGVWRARQDALIAKGITPGLVGQPTNMRGVKGFDDWTASRILGLQADPDSGAVNGCIVETWVGHGAHGSLRSARWRQAWHAVSPPSRLPTRPSADF